MKEPLQSYAITAATDHATEHNSYRARIEGLLHQLFFPTSPSLTSAALLTRIKDEGSGQLEKSRYGAATQRVYLNATPHVAPVPPTVWSFPIDGCQPARYLR